MFKFSRHSPQRHMLSIHVKKPKEKTKIGVEKFWHWCCKHPGIAAMIIPAFGGLVILSYLGPLGFIPDFNLSETFGLLVLAAFLGLFPIAMLITGLLIPALMLRCDFAEKLKIQKNDDKTYRLIALSTFVIFPILIIPVLLFEANWVFLLLFLPPLIILFYPRQKECGGWKKNLSRAGGFFILILLAVVSFLFAFIVFIPGASSGLADSSPWQQMVALLAWCLLVGCFNCVLLCSNKERFISYFIFAATALLFSLMLLTRNFSYVHILAIQKVQLGDIKNVTITVNESASAVLQAACSTYENLPFACARSQVMENKQRNHYTYERVTILSRMGSQYYLQLCPSALPEKEPKPCGANAENLPRVVIDKKDVLGWSTHKVAKQGNQPTPEKIN